MLVIDDELSIRKFVSEFLRKKGYTVHVAESGEAGYEMVQQHPIDLVLTDMMMAGWDGLTVLNKVKAYNPNIDVVVMTAYGDIQHAVKIMQAGAYHYLAKPFKLTELEQLIQRVDEKQALVRENQMLKQQLQEKYQFNTIISQSKEMEVILSTAARVADSKATVLITGESGTGKELIARAIHSASPRRDLPFVVIHLAAFSESLLESELFGHEKGSYTGATQSRVGYFEQADRGTLFIDEVGDIPLNIQVKLLRAIQFNQISRVGSNKLVNVDVRIIAATHRNLGAMIEEGSFREDLYYRLNVVNINIPPVRERKSDIPLLVNQFVQRFARQNGKTVQGLSHEALQHLMRYDFPGNVRELENMIERAVLLCQGKVVTRDDLALSLPVSSEGDALLDPHALEGDYDEKIREFEREILREALRRNDGNQSAAARMLKMSERRLRSRMEKLDMRP